MFETSPYPRAGAPPRSCREEPHTPHRPRQPERQGREIQPQALSLRHLKPPGRRAELARAEDEGAGKKSSAGCVAIGADGLEMATEGPELFGCHPSVDSTQPEVALAIVELGVQRLVFAKGLDCGSLVDGAGPEVCPGGGDPVPKVCPERFSFRGEAVRVGQVPEDEAA